MPLCKNHEACVRYGVYQNECIALTLCELSHCPDSESMIGDELYLWRKLDNLKSSASENERNEALGLLLCLLSGLPKIHKVEEVFGELLTLCNQGYLSKRLTYLALLSRQESESLIKFLNVDWDFLKDDERLCLGLGNSKCNIIMDLFVITVKNNCHWFIFLLDKLSHLLQIHCVSPVRKLLSHSFLENMCPLLFLYMLEQESSISSLKVPLELCLKMADCEPSIKKIAKKIQWYSTVIDWMEENFGECCWSPNIYLNNLSTLSLISQNSVFSSLQWSKTHKFLAENSLPGGCVAWWEISLFDAVSACQLALDYVLACLLSKYAKEAPSKSSYLEELKTILDQLQPLSVRMKVLEKIFSLLFLQFEDFQEDIQSDSEEEEVERETYQSLQHDKSASIKKLNNNLSSSMEILQNISETGKKLSLNPNPSPVFPRDSASQEESIAWRHSCLPKHGFVFDRFMTRNVLKMLESCLASFSISDSSCAYGGNFMPNDYILAPTERRKLELQLDALQNKVAKALWKLEILYDPDSFEQMCTDDSVVERSFPPDWVFQFCCDNESTSDDDTPGMKITNTSRRRSDVEKSSESGSQSNATPCGLKSKWNQRARRRSTTRFNARITKDSTIKKMMSSEECLVVQCLTKNKFEAAKKVIEALHLEDSGIATEVRFLENYIALKQKVRACEQECKRQSQFLPQQQSQTSMLKAIQRAASVGVQSSSLNKEVEKLLSSNILPLIHGLERVPGDFLHLFGGSVDEQPIVSAAVDISLMQSNSTRQAANFLNIASKYSDALRNLHTISIARPQTTSQPLGYLPLLQCILQVPISDSLSPSELLNRWDVQNFTSRSFKDTFLFWDKLEKVIHEFQEPSDYVGIYPKLLKLLSNQPSCKGLDTKQDIVYLHDFKLYLRLFKSCIDISQEPTPDGALSEEHFMLLQKNPCSLLAHLVLVKGCIPQNLELMASQLGYNLSHILSLELCSSLSSIPPAGSSVSASSTNPYNGVHVLNRSNFIGPSRHPAKAVEALLHSTLIELEQQLSCVQKLHKVESGSLPITLVNVKKMHQVVHASWEVGGIDLTLLEPGAETLAFYCNLSNLLFIHCMIYLFENRGHVYYDICLKSLVEGNSIQQLAAMNTLAYQVGSAGILTLWEVRRLALGGNNMAPLGKTSLQQYALENDSIDPLALFVISKATKHSPKLVVLKSEHLEEQLQECVQEYVRYWVEVGLEDLQIPKLVQQYIQNTGQNLRVFLRDHVDGYAKDMLDSMAEELVVSYHSEDSSPQIVIYYGTKVLSEVLDVDGNTAESSEHICENSLQYIKDHSPLVALLIQELTEPSSSEDDGNESDEEAQEATEITETSFRTSSDSFHQYPSLKNLCQRPQIVALSEVFNSNIMLCALHNFVPPELLWRRLDSLALEEKWITIYDILKALPKVQIQKDPMISVMKDIALLELAVECRDSGQSWLFCDKMNTVCLRAKAVIGECIYWSGQVCLHQFQKLLDLTCLRLYPVLYSKIQKLFQSVDVYEKVLENCASAPWKSWQEVQSLSHQNPAVVLEQILLQGSAEICTLWLDLHNIVAIHSNLFDNKVLALLLNGGEKGLRVAGQLLQCLPIYWASRICCETLRSSCPLPALRFLVSFLKSHCLAEITSEDAENISITNLGICMLEAVPEGIQHECIELIQSPNLMIEQLIMNVQLEAAQLMIKAVLEELVKLGPKSPLSIPALDAMLRQYAEKALEFRVTQGSIDSQTSYNNTLLTSLSSHSGSKDFIMPSVVPLKSQWVPNEQASVCMNCQISTFTMFNRRHHCRRCGRVVCSHCSPHKMIVQGYGSLKVRVCNSCQMKMNLQSEAEVSLTYDQTRVCSDSEASVSHENVWRLSNSSTYNETIRGEHAYEHAPSVSLCLSILKLHSESAACPNFLVDSCETVLSYILPQGGVPNPEVDYGFVIEMCRSLVLAAKVKCAQWGYISDEPHCDQRLSKIDLFGLLVSHGCTALIPSETSTNGLRRLQTQLIEAELWELALEVSTKSGMERIGVWSAWGKGCLRVGRWDEAREKFSHCFPNSSRAIRSAPDSPLLLEILQILESTPQPLDQEVLRKAESLRQSNSPLALTPAVTVLNSLAMLKNISQGKFNQTQGGIGSLESQVYAECCFYLSEYGSHASYLQFLVRHSDLEAALQHTLSNSVDSQTFFDFVYMPCVRKGSMVPLHSAMMGFDPSLITWKVYLHSICIALERRKLLHTLYEVQQWSKDHIRAAMTCIRFYTLNAKSYSQLLANMNYLVRAQSHLECAINEASSRREGHAAERESSPSSFAERGESMWLQLAPKEIDHHLSTVERQKELARFLNAYEATGHSLYEAANFFSLKFAEPLAHGLPTLFGSQYDRKLLAGLCLFCGKNVEEGYGIVYRIIQDFNLDSLEIYGAVAVALFHSGRVTEITQLLNCIRSSGVANPSSFCDTVLMSCIKEMPQQPNAADIDFLVRNISDPMQKIRAFIACGQLKSAYLLAVKYHRLDDVELILQEAEKLGQTAIQKICLKRLGR